MAAKRKSAKAKPAPKRRVKRRPPRKAPPRPASPVWAASPLADALDALVCDVEGGLIVAINPRGKAMLGYGGRESPVGTAFSRHVESPKETLASLGRGAQPKRATLAARDGGRIEVDLTTQSAGKQLKSRSVKSNGARSDNAGRMVIVARPASPSRPASPEGALSQTAQILSAAANGIVAVGTDGLITIANPAAGDLLDRDAGAMKGMPVERAFVLGGGHANAGKPLPLLAQFKHGPHYTEQEAHLSRSDGASFEAIYTVAPFSENREVRGYVITFRDITQRRRAEAELRLAAAVFDHSPEGLIVADARGRVTKMNPAYQRIVGVQASDVIGRQMSDVLLLGASASASVLDELDGKDNAEWEQWCKTKSGRRYAARISLSAVRDEAGQLQQYVGIVADITQRKLDEEKIIYQANYDQLTGLPNRTLFMDRLTRRVLEGRRAKTSVGLMFIDLDGFKAINDTLGHDAGDILLKSTARRLEKCVREADTVARLGGDEFTVIMPLIDSLEAAGIVAGRIIKSLTEPFDLNGREGRVSASIGISLLPAQADSASQLLHNADVAMYHAKHLGKANFQFYDPALESTIKVKDRDF